MNADAVAALLNEGVEAFRLTREYVGEDLLPPLPGWSWFDWCEKAEAALAAAPLPSEPRPVTERDRIEQAFIDGSVEGSHIDHDGALKEKP